MRTLGYVDLAMANTHLLVLVFYILLVLTYTILTFTHNGNKKNQGQKTLFVFILVVFPPFVFLYSLATLYVYFKEPKAKK